MKALQRFEKIIEAVRGKIEEEVSSLIGEQLALTLNPGALVKKAEFFDQPLGKLVVARMDLSGEVNGKGALILLVKDAIRLGGTLIMLPPSELEEVVSDERYEGETEDSYGEIANIIAGAYTKTFEEMYPKACRFVRKEQQVVVPLKVDSSSDDPIPDQIYYQIAMDMELDQRRMGTMFMLVPAEAFNLVEDKAADDLTAPPAEPSAEQAGEPQSPLHEASPVEEQPEASEKRIQPGTGSAAAGKPTGAARQAAVLAVET
ncbi:MAG: hypothetical protein IH612_18810, partial [Desulfofustis sp.]|nr:hypothetical protein [Desulfofustis sp.]